MFFTDSLKVAPGFVNEACHIIHVQALVIKFIQKLSCYIKAKINTHVFICLTCFHTCDQMQANYSLVLCCGGRIWPCCIRQHQIRHPIIRFLPICMYSTVPKLFKCISLHFESNAFNIDCILTLLHVTVIIINYTHFLSNHTCIF